MAEAALASLPTRVSEEDRKPGVFREDVGQRQQGQEDTEEGLEGEGTGLGRGSSGQGAGGTAEEAQPPKAERGEASEERARCLLPSCFSTRNRRHNPLVPRWLQNQVTFPFYSEVMRTKPLPGLTGWPRPLRTHLQALPALSWLWYLSLRVHTTLCTLPLSATASGQCAWHTCGLSTHSTAAQRYSRI